MFERDETLQKWLEAFIAAQGGVAGSVHLQRGEDLHLRAAHNLPPPVIAATTLVPRGKGMAGLAQVRRAAVQTCNLKTDTTGNVRPGARAVDAQAAIALPVLRASGEVLGVVGIAFNEEGEIPPAREQLLMKLAEALPLPR